VSSIAGDKGVGTSDHGHLGKGKILGIERLDLPRQIQRLSDRELACQPQVIEKGVDIGLGKCELGTCKNLGVFHQQTVVPQENDQSAQDEVKHPPRRAANIEQARHQDMGVENDAHLAPTRLSSGTDFELNLAFIERIEPTRTRITPHLRDRQLGTHPTQKDNQFLQVGAIDAHHQGDRLTLVGDDQLAALGQAFPYLARLIAQKAIGDEIHGLALWL